METDSGAWESESLQNQSVHFALLLQECALHVPTVHLRVLQLLFRAESVRRLVFDHVQLAVYKLHRYLRRILRRGHQLLADSQEQLPRLVH